MGKFYKAFAVILMMALFFTATGNAFPQLKATEVETVAASIEETVAASTEETVAASTEETVAASTEETVAASTEETVATSQETDPTMSETFEETAPFEEQSGSETLNTDVTPMMLTGMARGGAVISDFATLKAVLEDPDRAEEVIVPGGDYIFTDTVTISKPLVLKNVDGETVGFLSGLANTDSHVLGKTMLDIVSGGSLILSPDAADNFVFSGQNIETNTSDKGLFITVRNGAAATINNGVFCDTYNGGMQTAPLFVDGGELTLKNGRIENNKSTHIQTIANHTLSSDVNSGYAVSSGVAVRNKGLFTMDGGSITNNTFVTNTKGAGAVAVQNGTVVINGGELSANHAENRGGAIYAATRSTVTVNGGSFTDNSAKDGGAIFFDWVSKGTINGGTFSGNSATGMGGAIVTFDQYMVAADAHGGSKVSDLAQSTGMTHQQWIDYGLGVKLTVNGGTFDSNRAFAGGAFYISSNDTEINAATLTNNTATRFGGGIYLSAVPYVLRMRNVLIEENMADNIDQNISGTYNGVTIAMPQGSGGGVWYCPTGDSKVYISNGVAFLGNSAQHDGDDFTSVTKETGADYSVTIFERMLGGGLVNWYQDGHSQDASVPRYDGSQDPVSPLVDTAEAQSLKAIEAAGEGASFDAARQLATVFMSGNTAGRGGAICSNGSVIFGDPNKEFSLKVEKAWAGELSEADKLSVQIGLYAVVGDTEYLIQKEDLNKDNAWTHTFVNLPLEAGNQPIHFLVRELSDLYDVAYEGNDFTTESIAANAEIMVKITNTKKVRAVEVEKIWKDDENKDKRRPESISVKLLADGAETGQSVTLSKANGWKEVFTNLPMYKGKDEIIYTVKEVLSEEAYTSEVSGDAATGFIITNIPKPAEPTTTQATATTTTAPTTAVSETTTTTTAPTTAVSEATTTTTAPTTAVSEATTTTTAPTAAVSEATTTTTAPTTPPGSGTSAIPKTGEHRGAAVVIGLALLLAAALLVRIKFHAAQAERK